MKEILILVLILVQTTAKSQTEIPENIDIHKNVMTIANFDPDECALINSTRRGGGNIKDLIEIVDSTGAYDLGSGFVYEYGGEKYVITCEHVIFKASRIVGYDADYKPHELELVGGDTFYDVAVLKFKNREDAEHWRGVRFDFTPEDRTEVYAAGYWKLNGGVSVGSGKVLSEGIDLTDRKLPIVKIGYVESDAPTGIGYSGGALYNVEGQVVGMNNSVHEREGTSFALQSKIIKRVVHDILNNRMVQRAFLGIQFSQNISGGAVMLNKILDNAPATEYRKQLEGKSLTSINGKAIKDIYDVLKIMENTPAGKTISLELDTNSKVKLTTNSLNNAYHEGIILHAVREHENDDCVDIQVTNGTITLINSRGSKYEAKAAGLKGDRIYCINNLAQLGTLVRIFSLHGELRIGITDDKDKDDLFKRGRWVRFSKNDDMRVLYY